MSKLSINKQTKIQGVAAAKGLHELPACVLAVGKDSYALRRERDPGVFSCCCMAEGLLECGLCVG